MIIKEFVCKVKDKEFDIKLMGFGYWIYKNYDLCVVIIKKYVDCIMEFYIGCEDFFEIVKEFEEIVLNDDYFKECKFYLNVDFYIGFIYEVMGFLMNMFIVLFVLGCLFGWIV